MKTLRDPNRRPTHPGAVLREDVLPDLVKYCNVVMGNIWAANSLLEIPVDANIHQTPTHENYLKHATYSAQNIFEKFSNCKWVANTFRFDGNENAIEYYASLNTKTEQVSSPIFQITKVVDKVGSGDCFMAGLIYGIASNHPPKNIIGYAAAAAFGKLQEKGDATNNTVQQVEKILQNHSLNN